jgi:hypothetical protein
MRVLTVVWIRPASSSLVTTTAGSLDSSRSAARWMSRTRRGQVYALNVDPNRWGTVSIGRC